MRPMESSTEAKPRIRKENEARKKSSRTDPRTAEMRRRRAHMSSEVNTKQKKLKEVVKKMKKRKKKKKLKKFSQLNIKKKKKTSLSLELDAGVLNIGRCLEEGVEDDLGVARRGELL